MVEMEKFFRRVTFRPLTCLPIEGVLESYLRKVIGTPSIFMISSPWISERLLRKGATSLIDVDTETIKLGGKLCATNDDQAAVITWA